MDDGPPGFPRGFTCPVVLRHLLASLSVSHTGLSPSTAKLPSLFCYLIANRFMEALQPPALTLLTDYGILLSGREERPRSLESVNKVSAGFGLFPFRSPLLWESRLISLPPGTEMFHFPGFARTGLCIQPAVTRVCLAGLPHSEIPGSELVCSSPRLIAAYHVLHRLLTPRHPPCALNSLTCLKLSRILRLPPPAFALSGFGGFTRRKTPGSWRAHFGYGRARLSVKEQRTADPPSPCRVSADPSSFQSKPPPQGGT